MESESKRSSHGSSKSSSEERLSGTMSGVVVDESGLGGVERREAEGGATRIGLTAMERSKARYTSRRMHGRNDSGAGAAGKLPRLLGVGAHPDWAHIPTSEPAVRFVSAQAGGVGARSHSGRSCGFGVRHHSMAVHMPVRGASDSPGSQKESDLSSVLQEFAAFSATCNLPSVFERSTSSSPGDDLASSRSNSMRGVHPGTYESSDPVLSRSMSTCRMGTPYYTALEPIMELEDEDDQSS
ncbi:hypothetical protein FVE85_1967 [Porphyridium purpureum]|uniref:Uncharacterized protein n=1 Tax=Porphyridium purpureum TaxID=35688 RepID=A0A5J4YY54_PORPP|nr:hypothetical protein FVE85_1967 [Porphyridium purpureum]|eukprot:POR4359..scf209_3